MQNRVHVKKSIFASYMGCIYYDANGVDIIYRDINILLSHATMSTVHILPKRSWMCYNSIKLASMLPYKMYLSLFNRICYVTHKKKKNSIYRLLLSQVKLAVARPHKFPNSFWNQR